MPIGSSKLGVLGAGLVPGGSVTFNASGTWPIPPGVKKVSITGKGGTGNPGNAGNQGNPGNPGTGAGGGGGAAGDGPSNLFPCCIQTRPGSFGGPALKAPLLNGLQYACSQWPQWSQGPNNLSNKYTRGGGCQSNRCQNGFPGVDGQAGTAGTAGTAGNAGNPGNASNALGNTFPGGSGGNAGVAGNAGNGGTGGQLGAGGTRGGGGGQGGAGGNGGGQGGQGGSFPTTLGGVGGGGGAGVVNSGQNGVQGNTFPQGGNQPQLAGKLYAVAGGTGNPQVSYLPVGGSSDNSNIPGWLCSSNRLTNNVPTMQGGIGGGGSASPTPPINTSFGCGRAKSGGIAAWVSYAGPSLENPFAPAWNSANSNGRNSIANYNNPTLRPEVLRAGGGGGGTGLNSFSTSGNSVFGGGGGGGGRGNAGNAAGPTPTPTGSAGTPQTFNCVPVTPGTPTPITVGGPTGGQIVISWNPQ